MEFKNFVVYKRVQENKRSYYPEFVAKVTMYVDREAVYKDSLYDFTPSTYSDKVWKRVVYKTARTKAECNELADEYIKKFHKDLCKTAGFTFELEIR